MRCYRQRDHSVSGHSMIWRMAAEVAGKEGRTGQGAVCLRCLQQCCARTVTVHKNMQEEIREKSVALVIRVGRTGVKLTEEALKWAIRKYMGQGKAVHGKQSVKELVGQGAGVQSIEVTGKNIGSFERVARKYGVDFAVKKDPAQGKYLVFFKARDADALNAAFSEYTAKVLGRQKGKPSLRKQLDKFRQAAREMVGKEKNREKGGMER